MCVCVSQSDSDKDQLRCRSGIVHRAALLALLDRRMLQGSCLQRVLASEIVVQHSMPLHGLHALRVWQRLPAPRSLSPIRP